MYKMLRKKLLLLIILVLIIPQFISAEPVIGEASYNVKENGTVIYTSGTERTRACSRMNQFAEVPWSIPIGKSLSYKHVSGKTTTLTSGNYKGIPYTQAERDYSNPTVSVVQSRIDDAIDGISKVKGLDCSSAASYALRYATGNNSSENVFLKGKTSAYVSSCFFSMR